MLLFFTDAADIVKIVIACEMFYFYSTAIRQLPFNNNEILIKLVAYIFCTMYPKQFETVLFIYFRQSEPSQKNQNTVLIIREYTVLVI